MTPFFMGSLLFSGRLNLDHYFIEGYSVLNNITVNRKAARNIPAAITTANNTREKRIELFFLFDADIYLEDAKFRFKRDDQEGDALRVGNFMIFPDNDCWR